MICPNCKTNLSEGQRFCPNCGATVGASDSSSYYYAAPMKKIVPMSQKYKQLNILMLILTVAAVATSMMGCFKVGIAGWSGISEKTIDLYSLNSDMMDLGMPCVLLAVPAVVLSVIALAKRRANFALVVRSILQIYISFVLTIIFFVANGKGSSRIADASVTFIGVLCILSALGLLGLSCYYAYRIYQDTHEKKENP